MVVDRPLDSDVSRLPAVLSPDEDEVESDETLLLVVDRPVDEDVDSELILDEADVEREETLLFVVERPVDDEVDSEPT